MRTMLSKLFTLAVTLGVTAGANAQILPNPLPLPFPSYKWDQRYTPPRATFTSRVISCTAPQPAPAVAIDDWLCTKPGPINRIGWWGWLSTTAQAQRPFYIAIYRQDPNNQCRPFPQPVYQACVIPDQVKLVSKSCEFIPGTNQQRPIYYLSAKLPTPFTQDGTAAAPQHYFLQISEIDAQSVQPNNIEDFRWAGRRPIQVCPAMQRTAAGLFVQPLIDPCDQKEDDLSFRLFSRSVTGTLNPNIAVAGSVTFHLYALGRSTGDTVPTESLSLNFTKIEYRSPASAAENTFSIDFDSPDGAYMLEVHAPGALPQRTTIILQEGTEFQVDSFFDIFYGDLNGDGACNTIDLTLMLGNFGRTSH